MPPPPLPTNAPLHGDTPHYVAHSEVNIHTHKQPDKASSTTPQHSRSGIHYHCVHSYTLYIHITGYLNYVCSII